MSSVPHQPCHHFNSTVCEVITAPKSQGCLLARSGGCNVDHINVGRKVWGQKGSCITGGCSMERLAAIGPEGMWLFLLILYPQHKLYCESGASGIVLARLQFGKLNQKKIPALFSFPPPTAPTPAFLALLHTQQFIFSFPISLAFYSIKFSIRFISAIQCSEQQSALWTARGVLPELRLPILSLSRRRQFYITQCHVLLWRKRAMTECNRIHYVDHGLLAIRCQLVLQGSTTVP